MTALSHRKPPSAGTSHDNCCAGGHHESDACLCSGGKTVHIHGDGAKFCVYILIFYIQNPYLCNEFIIMLMLVDMWNQKSMK
jgi:hypothetical protein